MYLGKVFPSKNTGLPFCLQITPLSGGTGESWSRFGYWGGREGFQIERKPEAEERLDGFFLDFCIKIAPGKLCKEKGVTLKKLPPKDPQTGINQTILGTSLKININKYRELTVLFFPLYQSSHLELPEVWPVCSGCPVHQLHVATEHLKCGQWKWGGISDSPLIFKEFKRE